MGRPKKKIITTTEEEIGGATDETEDTPGGIPEDIQEYISLNAVSKEYSAFLYRLDPQNPRTKWQCAKFMGECPDGDAIGKRFGAGKYELVIAYYNSSNTRVFKKFTINIAAEYDNGRPGHSTGGAPVQVINTGTQLEQLRPIIGLIKELSGMFQQQQQQPVFSPAAFQGMNAMQEYMVKMQIENMKTLQNAMRENLMVSQSVENLDGEDGEEMESDVEKILNAIKTFLPLLTGKESNAAAIVEAAKSTAEYKRMASDNKRLAAVISALENDPSIPREKVETILKRFGLKRKGA